MEKSAEKSNLVGIIVPTLNRPDFVIRQLNYYASLNSPYNLYYSDAGNPENAKKIKDEIEKLKNKLNIVYLVSPAGNSIRAVIQLLTSVQEKYVAFMGDDDYWIPDAVNQCAEFLEKNPDYETAIGKSVTFKTENNAVFGKIKAIHDYPRHSIEDDTASERLFNYLGPNLSAITAAIMRTDHLLNYYQDSVEIKDANIRGEILPSCLMLIAGKSKVIDKLGFVRQIHDSHFKLSDMFDWILNNENWHSSYTLFKDRIVTALMAKDNISPEKAKQVFKQSLWFHFNKYMPRFYNQYANAINPPRPQKKSLRTKIAARLPLLKKVYRRFIAPFVKKDQLHCEVIRPGSEYYRDFKAIVDSLKQTDTY